MEFTKEELAGYVEFIKDRIEQSFFAEEKVALHRGLKFLGYSLEKFLSIQINEFVKDEVQIDESYELDVLNLPRHPFAQTLEKKLKRPSKHTDDIMLEFTKVQLNLAFIVFEFYKMSGAKEAALYYAQFILKNMDKLSARIGELPPDFVQIFIDNMAKQHQLLLADVQESETITATYSINDEEKEMLRQIVEGYYYWPRTATELAALYVLLDDGGFIESTESFDALFKNKDNPNLVKIKWIGDQTQLMYLMQLIYDGKSYYKNEPIFHIAIRLFCDKDGREFSAKNLSTTSSVVQAKIRGKKLTKKLIAISDIFSQFAPAA